MKVLVVFVLALPLPALATEVGSFDLHLESALASQIVEGEPPRMGLRLATPPPMTRFARRVALDFVDGLRLPLHMTRRKWKLLGLSALGVGAVSLLDEQIQDLLGAGPGSAGSDFALTIRPPARSVGGSRSTRGDLAVVATKLQSGNRACDR